MLLALAFVPSPPLLLPALGGGPAELRSACQKAIASLGDVDRVVVVGAAPQNGWLTGGIDATKYGAPGPSTSYALPLALAVGSSLLGDRPHELYGVCGSGLPDLDGRTGLLVVADGTARRSEKAPGYHDERAARFDAQVETALAAADPVQLGGLDPELADSLMVAGLAAWRAAAAAALREIAPSRAASAGWSGQVHLAAAPYGVGYVAASWIPAT